MDAEIAATLNLLDSEKSSRRRVEGPITVSQSWILRLIKPISQMFICTRAIKFLTALPTRQSQSNIYNHNKQCFR
jgi:hypothetical protein